MTGRVGLLHATDFTLPPTLPGARTILTIHDLAFERHPEETMPGMLGFLRRAVPDSIRRADHVIAVSEATRADLIDLYGTPPGKISVVPHGVSLRFHPRRDPHQEARVRQRYDLPDGPLVLTVGTHQPRKNHIRLVRAFGQMVGAAGQDSEPAPMLVIAGGLGWAYEDVMAEIAQLGLRQRVALVGFVDDADLPDLYRAAAVFAFPALYEGFGLPVLEAMACGVPVVTSNTSSLPEVTGPDAALLVDPHSEDSIAAALTRLLHDDALHAHLRQQGIARAAEFTWARAAESTWGIYEAALADQV
jgi:glycosyltransferase involved in cell wall biosynthesis